MASKAFLLGADTVFSKLRQDKSIHSNAAPPGVPARKDVYNSGKFKVAGTVAVSGTPDIPVARIVCLFDQKNKKIIRSQVSSENGAYSFENIAKGPWTIISWDHTLEYNAAASADIYGNPG